MAETDGRIAGYLTGCPDTAAFRRARRFRVTLPLLVAIACRRYPWNADARRLLRLVLRRSAAWSRASPPRSPRGSLAPTPPTCT